MENKEKITLCRLCLNSCNSTFINVDEPRGKILDALFPRSKLKVSGVLCENCAENLQTTFEFKSNCLYVEECIDSFMSRGDNVKVDIKAVYLSMNKCKNEVNIAEGYTVCRLCMELSNSNCMSLNENRKGDISVQMMVQKCIPEVNLTITEDPVICRSCYASLYDYFTFLKNHSDIEEKKKLSNMLESSGNNITNYRSNFVDINQHEEEENSNYENCIDIKPNIKSEKVYIKLDKEMIGENVLGYKTISWSNKCCENENSEVELKYENVEISDNGEKTDIDVDKGEVKLTPENASGCKSEYSNTVTNFHEKEKNGEFTLKNCVEDNTQALNIKLEDTEIKSEENDDARYQHIPSSQPELDQQVYTDSSGLKHKGNICAYETKCKHILTNSHTPIHKEVLEATMHQCDTCNFVTKLRTNLKRHMLVHKDLSETTFYSCEACDYKTKYTKSIKQHLLTHRHPSEVTMYECDLCKFKTKHRKSLKGHMLLHKSAAERTMYNCDLCTYKAKRRHDITRHVLIHKDGSDVTWYQCDMCEYKSKHTDRLKKHKVIHKSASEVISYQCSVCKYKTKYTSHLSRHMLIHKDVSEVTIYQCEICGQKTKYKTSLEKHLLLHKNATEVAVYKCERCEFKTRHKGSLKTHALFHKEVSEVKIYECEVCVFKTKYKGSLKQHMVVHKKNSSDNSVLC